MLPLLLTTSIAISLVLLVRWMALVWNAPYDDEALRLSVARTEIKVLALAFAVDPSFCILKGRGRFTGGEVKCENVPIHLFEDRKVCDSKGLHCQPEYGGYVGCTDYYWDLDLRANPWNSMPSGDRRYASIGSGPQDCNKGWTRDGVRSRLTELGLTPVSVSVWGRVERSRRR